METSVYQYIDKEVHLFVPERMTKIIVTRNGKKFEFTLPE